MTLFKRAKSKKVISMVLGLIISMNMMFTSHSMDKREVAMTTPIKIEQVVATNKQTQQTSSAPTLSHNVVRKLRVGATAYCGDTITSTGTRPVEGTTIAVDPTVIPYGTKVYIPQFNRVFIAEDCGSAIKGNRIDIFMNSYDNCMEWGFQNIDIYIVK